MTDKELYQQKRQAQLDTWKAEVAELKAKVSGASADAQLGLNKQVHALEKKVDEGRAELSRLAEAGEDTWESVKERVETAWSALTSAVSDATARLRQ